MSKKMCKLVDKKLPKEDPEKYCKLIQNATHYCKNCGLVSSKKDMLCKPEKIDQGENDG